LATTEATRAEVTSFSEACKRGVQTRVQTMLLGDALTEERCVMSSFSAEPPPHSMRSQDDVCCGQLIVVEGASAC